MSQISHILLIALFFCISSARDPRRSSVDWNYDGEITRMVDFANDIFDDDSKFIIFGSYAAHLASYGMLPFRDIDIALIQPSEDPAASVPIDFGNRTVVNYHGRRVDLKVGSVASMDDLLDAVNINAVAVAFEFEKKDRDDIRLVNSLKDPAFDNFRKSKTLQLLEPQRATPKDCIRILAKAHRYKYAYVLDDLVRHRCAEPQILSPEQADIARRETTGEFRNQVFDLEGSNVWARNLAEAQEYFVQESHQGERRSLADWWDSDDEGPLINGYFWQGWGKCVTNSGADPAHMYFHGIGEEQCRLKCDYEPDCWGFTVSSHGNCLHWMDNNIKAGGANWGPAKTAKCWIAHGVVDGRRNLGSAQNFVSKDRRLLQDSDDFTLSHGYYDVGLGKCVTTSGGDPAFNYLHGVGEDTCRSMCSGDSQCFGFSVSIYGNCLHWTTDDLQESGGPSWGGARCWIDQTLLDSRFDSNSVQRGGRRKN